MNTKPAIANARAFEKGQFSEEADMYLLMLPRRPTNVPVLLKNSFTNLFFVTPILFPTNWPLSDSQGEIKIGIKTKIPISKGLEGNTPCVED